MTVTLAAKDGKKVDRRPMQGTLDLTGMRLDIAADALYIFIESDPAILKVGLKKIEWIEKALGTHRKPYTTYDRQDPNAPNDRSKRVNDAIIIPLK